jgi:hypothetical protein
MFDEENLDFDLLDKEIEIDEDEFEEELESFVKKQPKQEKQLYIDDKELTELLIKELTARKAIADVAEVGAKLPGPSELLGEWFVKVTHRMLTRGNFRNYSDNYKDEFKSDAYLFFARYWWKFDPRKVAQNLILLPNTTIVVNKKQKTKTFFWSETKESEKIEYVPDMKDAELLLGGFSYFTTLAWTGTLGALSTLKKADEFRQNLAENMMNDSRNNTTLDYFNDRHFSDGM